MEYIAEYLGREGEIESNTYNTQPNEDLLEYALKL
jgi:hypothetical protein